MALSREERIERLVDGLVASGYGVAAGYDSSGQPLLLEIGDGRAFSLAVFSWAITHGGATRDPSEYRVQTTRPNAVPLLVEGRQSLVIHGKRGRSPVQPGQHPRRDPALHRFGQGLS